MNNRLLILPSLSLLLIFTLQLAAGMQSSKTKPPYAADKILSEPTLFGEGVVSTGDFDSHPAFTPDGKTVYFDRSTPTFNLWTILVSRFERGKWATPEVAAFSGQ